MTKEEINGALNEQYTRILNLRSKLSDTDYIAAKIAEGKATKSEYSEKIEMRQQWRDEINEAEEEVFRLKSLTTDDERDMEG